MRTIYIAGIDGSPVLQYLCLPDGHYFGGNTRLDLGLDHGPHVSHYPRSLLELIARLANEDGSPYTMTGGISGGLVQLQPEMDAGEIAGVLGIGVEEVLKRYSLLVRPPKEH